MDFEPSTFDYENQTYGVDVSDYPVQQDTSISISAVVSASCVIVNDPPPPPQYDVSGPANSQFHFPQNSFHDEPGRCQDFDDSKHNHNACVDFTEQLPFSNSIEQQYFQTNQETISEAIELQGNSFPDSSPYGWYETDMMTGYTQRDPTVDACGRNTVCFDAVPFDSNTFYSRPSTSISSCEGFYPDSSTSSKSEPVTCDTQAPLDKTVSGAKTPSVDFNVDEMIGSGVTVAGFKPRGIIRKRKKSKTPSDAKDGGYWSKRVKNNDSARRSRETKKEKERNFYKRALELEYENFYLKEKVTHLEGQLSSLSAGRNNTFQDSFV